MGSRKGYKEAAFWSVLFVGFAVVPLFKASGYELMLAGHILVWGLFAVSFNMLWGGTGMLSFGQALYYGLGGYSVGLMFKHYGQDWFLLSILIGIVVAIVLSILIGLLIIRVSGVFFTVMTLAFGQLAWQITFRWYGFTGGDDGIQGIIPPGILGKPVVYYYFMLILVAGSIYFLRRLSESPMGLVLRCVRQNPDRVRFLGQSVKRNQLTIYMISSAIATLAGSLMAGVDNSIHPNMLYWTTSGEVILMSVLGGMGQFFGPLIGAAILVIIEDVVGGRTEFWPLIVGIIMMVMVLLFPRGVVGEIQQFKARFTGSGRQMGD